MTIIITGTSTGIGFALAEYFGKKGNKVYGLSRKNAESEFFKTIPTDITDNLQILNAISEILKTEKPDIILLDIMMPNVDGYTTLAEIRKNPAFENIKVIFLSAKTGEENIKKGLEMGADSYVTKPYSIKKLMEQVEELLKK